MTTDLIACLDAEIRRADRRGEEITASTLRAVAEDLARVRAELATANEALEAIHAEYHFVEGSPVGINPDAPHWEKCPGCIAARALAGKPVEETCGKVFAHPAPRDYEFCYQPKGHEGRCAYEPRRAVVSSGAPEGEREPMSALSAAICRTAERMAE